MYASFGQIFNLPTLIWTDLCIAQELSIGKQSDTSFSTYLVPSSLGFFMISTARLHVCLNSDWAHSYDTHVSKWSWLRAVRGSFFPAHTKHIEVHYHYVTERDSIGEIRLVYVPTQDNVAGLFTKALSRERFEAFGKSFGLLLFVNQTSVQIG
ncbi:hypothetical protein KP509_25G063700 [Ceratopteris richardii]|uniref:Uncharacterized protein n=1 Tax=Ceratopteris richardii TaxID=49495 RepID=A0A8T2RTY5_CERRI|nr:hypothetical protein KP509_25G063700 [Ceratopteris richardii]